MIKLPSITQIQDQLALTAQRFPLPTTCAVGMTLLGLYTVHFDLGQPPTWLWQSLITFMLAAVSLTAITLAVEPESKTTRSLSILAAVALLGVYWWSLPNDPDQVGSLWIMRHAFLMLASLVALVWAPYWRQKSGENLVLWRWCTDLIGSFVVTVFFAIVLFLGTAAAIWSIDALFGVNVNDKLYFDIWILAAALFSPLFFLSQFAPEPLKLKAPKTVNAFLSIFTKYIMTPIASVYLVILYAYTAKILLTWEWPKNVLGWLVICFLGVAIFTYFLWTPLLKPSFNKYRRIFWLILVPQIVLLFIAIGWRIHAYSWTENRYFVVVLGLWLLGTTLYFLVREKAKFKWAFAALTAIILLSQIGPFSGYNIGTNAQTKRLMAYLEQSGIQPNEPTAKKSQTVDRETENQIASILDYLRDRHGRPKLEALFPTTVANIKQQNPKIADYIGNQEIMEAWGLTYRSKWERRNNDGEIIPTFSYYLEASSPRNITGYNWRAGLDYPESNPRNNTQPTAAFPYRFVRATNESLQVLVQQNQQTVETIDLSEPLQKLAQINRDTKQRDTLSQAEARYVYESERFNVLFYFTNLYGESQVVKNFDAEIYVQLKE